MSGMYNMVLGRHPIAPHLLGVLGFESAEEVARIPRLRDVYLFEDSIAILTRTGGGNRDEYEDNEQNPWLRTLPGYLNDHDDEYDPTYAWWHYEWPEEHREALQAGLEAIKENRPELLHESLRHRFEEAITNMRKPRETEDGS